MDKKETILLDARLTAVIDKHAFNAELRNGHRFVAFFGSSDARKYSLSVNDMVKVQMSPFDMSKGRLVFGEE